MGVVLCRYRLLIEMYNIYFSYIVYALLANPVLLIEKVFASIAPSP